MKPFYLFALIVFLNQSLIGLFIYQDMIEIINTQYFSINTIFGSITSMILGLVLVKLTEKENIVDVKVDLPRTYMFYTIKRNNKTMTIVDEHSNMLVFLEIEKELGNKTFMLFAKELTKEEYDFYIENNRNYKSIQGEPPYLSIEA